MDALCRWELQDGLECFSSAVDLAPQDARHGKVTSGSGFIAKCSFLGGCDRISVQGFGCDAFGVVGFRLATPGQGVGSVVELTGAAERAESAEFIQFVG